MSNKLAICASCHATAVSFGNSWKNDKNQTLVKIRPHWRAGEVQGLPCSAKIGVVTGNG